MSEDLRRVVYTLAPCAYPERLRIITDPSSVSVVTAPRNPWLAVLIITSVFFLPPALFSLYILYEAQSLSGILIMLVVGANIFGLAMAGSVIYAYFKWSRHDCSKSPWIVLTVDLEQRSESSPVLEIANLRMERRRPDGAYADSWLTAIRVADENVQGILIKGKYPKIVNRLLNDERVNSRIRVVKHDHDIDVDASRFSGQFPSWWGMSGS